MEWTRGHVLGRGSTATVTSATSTSGDLFAVKSVDFRHAETLKKEQYFLSILKSPYVISYKGCDTTRENNNLVYNMFIEHMSRGSVTDVVNRRSGKGLDEFEIARYTRDIVKGLEYIHDNGIVHCDIKGRNILIDEFGVKIGDFGCAKRVDDVAPVRGTPMFMAPEVARGEEQGCPADIWALGCTVVEMATGESPWPEVNDDSPWSVFYKIGFSDESPKIPDGLSEKAKGFLKKCLVRDPGRRWTARELLEHPFLEIRELEENSKGMKCEKMGVGPTGSPTSVLDQDVWNSTRESMESDSKSLRQRIEQLVCKSEMPNWRCENNETDWIMIRTNGWVTRGVSEDMQIKALSFGFINVHLKQNNAYIISSAKISVEHFPSWTSSKAGVFPPIGAHGPVVSPAGAIAGWMATANPFMPRGPVAAGPPGPVQPPVADYYFFVWWFFINVLLLHG
ncbi:mitogen-activated protein kinase kinase kinase 17-like [Bidens hawaiensis]|uniref:mitogen-activated protein kinase kinase kinase 17-like n=1 Tax=Bidens hawaiensis TaxID=980011 RepID=UPI00404B808B